MKIVNLEHEKTARAMDTLVPPATCYETNEEMVVLADLPGVNRDSLTIDLENETLVLQAETEPWEKASDMAQEELPAVEFHRVFKLAPYVDRDSISAKFENGVLRLHLPKLEAAKARKIEISMN